MKQCCLCNINKYENEFYLDKQRKDGLSPRCKDCHSLCMKKSRVKHKAKLDAANKKYRDDNKDLIAEQSHRYYINNRDKVMERNNKWRKQNKYKSNIKTLRYRSRKNSLPTTLTKEEWDYAINYFNNKCAYCNNNIGTLHQEHFVPVLSGGPHSKENIIPACVSCNSSKSNKVASDWMLVKFGKEIADIRIEQIKKYFKHLEN